MIVSQTNIISNTARITFTATSIDTNVDIKTHQHAMRAHSL